MPAPTLFPTELTVADRQPKTDRLVLKDLLNRAAGDKRLEEPVLRAAHKVLIKWAELDSAKKLTTLNETQMQGDFLAEVFGQALGYAGATDGTEVFHRQQHHEIAGETPDAVLGFFQHDQPLDPLAVVELKGPKVHLDRDRSNGRTAVGQCWDYLINSPPTCRWGIVSNYVSFRLYERSSTKQAYEHFKLQDLRNFDEFRRFYALFHRQGLIDKYLGGLPRAVALLKESSEQQRKVGDELYDNYSRNRLALIEVLHFKEKHPLHLAIEMAQRLFDRIMFIAFCEDRHLLPEKTI
ncbi:MAG TPA: hypothetical protein VFV87_17155, partial [Pirellulaceae bacterium]|nr:hypothetical protein [Pirellulaceae bacterium]